MKCESEADCEEANSFINIKTEPYLEAGNRDDISLELSAVSAEEKAELEELARQVALAEEKLNDKRKQVAERLNIGQRKRQIEIKPEKDSDEETAVQTLRMVSPHTGNEQNDRSVKNNLAGSSFMETDYNFECDASPGPVVKRVCVEKSASTCVSIDTNDFSPVGQTSPNNLTGPVFKREVPLEIESDDGRAVPGAGRSRQPPPRPPPRPIQLPRPSLPSLMNLSVRPSIPGLTLAEICPPPPPLRPPQPSSRSVNLPPPPRTTLGNPPPPNAFSLDLDSFQVEIVISWQKVFFYFVCCPCDFFFLSLCIQRNIVFRRLERDLSPEEARLWQGMTEAGYSSGQCKMKNFSDEDIFHLQSD